MAVDCSTGSQSPQQTRPGIARVAQRVLIPAESMLAVKITGVNRKNVRLVAESDDSHRIPLGLFVVPTLLGEDSSMRYIRVVNLTCHPSPSTAELPSPPCML
jgi:hypothetical protein